MKGEKKSPPPDFVHLIRLPQYRLPPVQGLEGGSWDADRGDIQLIHGDYAASNLIATPSGLRVIDFDGCGEGSSEAEIGNSLYHTTSHPPTNTLRALRTNA